MLCGTLKTFKSLTKHPEHFLESHGDTAEKVRNSLKEIYDFIQEHDSDHQKKKILPKLIIKNFDDEQVWQELELHNSEKYDECFINVTNFLAKKEKLSFPLMNEIDNTGNDYHENDFIDDPYEHSVVSSHGPFYENNNSKPEVKTKEEQNKRKRKASIVDDTFFKLSELEEFLNKEDKLERQNRIAIPDEESIDYFEETASDNEEKEKDFYNDFFDGPGEGEDKPNDSEDEIDTDNNKKKKKLRFQLTHSDDSNGDDPHYSENMEETKDKPKSNFDIRQERLQSRIQALEEVALSDKPWQMSGEISGSSRPQNSLLEEVLEFDMTTRPAPVMTEQTTWKLEDIVLQRIKDKAWDDVERKVKPVLAPDEYKKKIVMDQEKSKLSLAEVYEQEYLKKKESLNCDPDDKPEEEPPEHRTIRSMMSSLFAKLDALTNFHFTPKMVIPEIKIVSNLPAITMEEVAPVAATDSTLLAPQEIKVKQKGAIIGSTERTKTDKNRERRTKKQKQRIRQKEKEKVAKIVEKLRPGLGNKYHKETAMETLKKLGKSQNVEVEQKDHGSAVRSSAKFFSRLQEEKSIGTSLKAGKTKKEKQEFSVKNIKL